MTYDVSKHWDFTKAYIDIDEWRGEPVRHQYIHGGFYGSKLKFSFYFPPKEQYEKRFYHFVAPVQGNENAAQSQKYSGDKDRMAFAITHGSYLVESNMGGDSAKGSKIFESNAAVAAYSRVIAAKLYGEHRPYGYIFGGSGGSLKTISCIENTEGIWDGAVPYVIGSPVAMPNVFTVRAHAMRILRHKLPEIVDSLEVGGDTGKLCSILNDEELEAFREVTKMGFPLRSWFSYDFIGDGALPVLAPAISQIDPEYYQDFWEIPGYLGADPASSANRDRFQFKTSITDIYIPDSTAGAEFAKTGVDEAWHKFENSDRFVSDPLIKVENSLPENAYFRGARVYFLDGRAAGESIPLQTANGTTLLLGKGFKESLYQVLIKVKPGDKVIIDNSDYIALQTYHRHQVPEKEFTVWDQFCDKNRQPLYPQRDTLVGPILAYGGAGSIQSGRFKGKMILIGALMDESAFPWMTDWYHQKVKEHLGNKMEHSFRLWYMDHAMHAETEGKEASLHVVSYQGALCQALLDVSAWVEKGIEPAASTNYTVEDGQVHVSKDPKVRKGIQPVIEVKANGKESVTVKAGTPIVLRGKIDCPDKAGQIISAQWDFDGKGKSEATAGLHYNNRERSSAVIETTCTYAEPGIYFPVLRATANRRTNGINNNDPFTQIKNLCRVRVIVE